MRIGLVFLFFVVQVFATEFYAKLEPINTYVVKSSVSGEVIYTNDKLEGEFAKNSTIIRIDSTVNRIDLEGSLAKLKILENMISVEQKNYEKIKKVSTKSDFEKDAQKLKVLNYESQIADLKIKIETLKDQISNKTLSEKDGYIYSIDVKKGDYVNPGSQLYVVKDLSHGKLEIFLPIDMAQTYSSKTIYLDGEKTDLKIDKLYTVADSKHISSYKCEIIVPNPKQFSKLVKVEFK